MQRLASPVGVFAKVDEGLGRSGENFQLIGDKLDAQVDIAASSIS